MLVCCSLDIAGSWIDIGNSSWDIGGVNSHEHQKTNLSWNPDPLLTSQCHCPSSHALRGPTIDPHHHYDKHSTCPMGQHKFFPEPLWSSPVPDWLSDDVTFSLIHHRIDFNCRSLSRPNWIVTLSSPNWIVTAPVGRVSHPCSSCLLSKGTSLNLQK